MKIKEIINSKKTKIEENASSGATSSGNVATIAVPLGGWIGFEPKDQWRSIYRTKKKKSKKK